MIGRMKIARPGLSLEWMTIYLLFLLPVPSSQAQISTASVTGTVEDVTAARIPDANVKLLNTLTGTENDSKTNHSGVFLLSGVIPGEYTLEIDQTGFSPIQVTGLVLRVGESKNFLVRMQVGSVTQTVDVDNVGIGLDSADASVNTVVNREFVANMPLNGRSFEDLITMTPGVVTASPQMSGETFGAQGEFSVNGQQTDANSFSVDGVSADVGASLLTGHRKIATAGSLAGLTAIGTTQSLVSVDALQEFRVLGSTYSTEYGRSPGGQFTLLTRSGTNTVHGSFYNYVRVDTVDASDWYTRYLQADRRTAYHQDDFGGTLGMPLSIPGLYSGTNRSFLFLSYEGLNVEQPSAPVAQFVPSVSLIKEVPAALQPVLNDFPVSFPSHSFPESPTTDLVPFVDSATSYPGTIGATSVRLDHTLSRRLSGFFRYGTTPSNSETGILTSITRVHVATQTATFGVTAQLSPRMSNDVRVGYAASSSTLTTILNNFQYNLLFFIGTKLNSDLGLPTSSASASADAFIQIPGAGASEIKTDQATSSLSQWNVRDTFNVAVEHHLLKVGIDQRNTVSRIAPPALAVESDFFTIEALKQNSASAISITKTNPAAPRFEQFAAFVQDEWQLSKSFTLSPGIRWEFSPPPHGEAGGDAYTALGSIANPTTLTLAPRGIPLWHSGKYNFAPRVGAVWAVNNTRGREVLLRAGAGVFFGTANRPASEAFNAVGFSATHHQVDAPVPITSAQLDFSSEAATPYTNTIVFAFPQHLQLPYSIQWNVALEKSLGEGQTLSLSWLGTDGRRLLQERRIDVRDQNPNFGEVNYFPGQLSSSYQALQLRFQRAISHGLQILGSYGWAHAIDYGSTNPVFPLTRASSDLDVRHNLQTAFTWDLPIQMATGTVGSFMKGWGIDGRVTARTAFPVTPLGNIFSDPATGDRYYSGTDLIPTQPKYIYGPLNPGGRVFNGGPNAADPAFALPSGSSVGDAPRNILRGFGAYQLNLAVRKEFPVYDRIKLQLRLDTFNLFNHPTYGYIDPVLTDLQFGQPTRLLNQSFGSTGSLYEPGGPRSIQLAVRLHF
jgi:hypothetical protein